VTASEDIDEGCATLALARAPWPGCWLSDRIILLFWENRLILPLNIGSVEAVASFSFLLGRRTDVPMLE
jgi:hypothetical protein